jgi:hypothetical protein
LSQPNQVETDDQGLTERIRALLQPGENLYAVFSASVANNDGGLGITDFRSTIYARSIVTRHPSFVSVYYSQVSSVGITEVHGKGAWAAPLVWITSVEQTWNIQFSESGIAKRAHQLINWNLMRVERKRLGLGPQ